MTFTLDQLARDEIVYLPLSAIDPDPHQPRLDVDEELADSIKQHGVLQAIQVRPHPSGADDRWMIVDGERRYRGATRAKAGTIPATITLEVEDDGDRIVRQIVRNEGKPLTPSEEAVAYKRIIASKQAAGAKSYGVVQLAKELGLAKSTVSDRLAMNEIPEFWLLLIANGPLQPSHVPLLHKWRKVPEKYQRQALEQMRTDYRWPGGETYSKAKKGERIYVEMFETLLRTFMAKFIKPVSDVPGYDGPTERGKFESYGDAKTYAMDPAKWQPIWRKAIAANRTKDAKEAELQAPSRDREPDKWGKQRAREQEERERWIAAAPRILDAASAVIGTASIDLLAPLIVDNFDNFGDAEEEAGRRFPLPAQDMTAEALVRYLAMHAVANVAGDGWALQREFPKLAKQLGLEVNELVAGSGDEPEAEASHDDKTQADREVDEEIDEALSVGDDDDIEDFLDDLDDATAAHDAAPADDSTNLQPVEEISDL